MNTRKTITAICAGALALATATISMAETKEDYIKTFGMIMFERNGLLELEFTPEEFNAFVEGMKVVNETKRLPDEVMQIIPEKFRLRIPMVEKSRCLNLSNAVAVMAYEAWRQLGFIGAKLP